MRMNLVLTPRLRRPLLPLVAIVLGGGCGGGDSQKTGAGARTVEVPARAATQYVVAVDLSTSLTDTERGNHKVLLDALAAGLEFGDRLVLLKAHPAGVKSDTATPRIVTMPSLEGEHPLQSDLDELDMQREAAANAVASLFKTAPLNGTDLFATMHSAGERSRESEGKRNVLLVLSDMLQCTSGSVCMERVDELPDSSWIITQKEQGLVPSLDSVCVSVVGADASTAQGVKVREFWNAYFRAAGARFSPARYVHGASTPTALRCDG